ncbi:MAG: hypothetical protein ACR2NN_03025 [Bryobacteraceae bacterium]
MRLRTTSTVSVCTVAIACGMGIRANAGTIAITYSLAGDLTRPPVMTGTTLTLDALETGSVLSGNPSLNAIWNPVTYNDHSVVDLTTGLLNGTFSLKFADGNTLSGKLFEDTSKLDAAGVGPFTQTLTFTGGTGEFAGATGSASGPGVGGTNGFMSSGSGTINAPAAVPEPASASLLLSRHSRNQTGLDCKKLDPMA